MGADRGALPVLLTAPPKRKTGYENLVANGSNQSSNLKARSGCLLRLQGAWVALDPREGWTGAEPVCSDSSWAVCSCDSDLHSG